MRKISTLFKRDMNNGGRITKEYSEYLEDFPNGEWTESVATEKLDGTNVRLTVRNHQLMRLEKRRNPDKIQKHNGIEEPWYVDADLVSPQDKWITDALNNTDLSKVPDGEWSGEAVGPDIQGNPIGLPRNSIVFFSLGQAPVHENVPTTFDELKIWLPKQQSKFGAGTIEGIVWHWSDGSMAKIKVKDFKQP